MFIYHLTWCLTPKRKPGQGIQKLHVAYMPDWENRERRLQAHTSETTKKSKRIAIA